MGNLDGWRSAAADLLLGARCAGCGLPAWGLCAECTQAVVSRAPYLTTPDPTPAGFPRTVTSSPYDAVLRGAISAHKERQALGLTTFLTERLAVSVHALLRTANAADRPVVLVPVPSAGAAVRARGFDSTWALARGTARRLAGRHHLRAERLLAQRRGVGDQAGLSATDRAANLREGIVWRRGGGRRPDRVGALVVVVDDLVTTGASLTEATRVLSAAGVEVLGAATVAATVRLRRPRERRGDVGIGQIGG